MVITRISQPQNWRQVLINAVLGEVKYYRNIQLSPELEEAAQRASRKCRQPTKKPSAS